MPVRIVALDHVQLAMPPGQEDTADRFYCGVLGMVSIPKPEPLAARGGRWYGAGEVQVHLGVEPDFRPAKKAHPALRVVDFEDLETRLEAVGATWRWDHELPDVRRIYVDDPFGNRVELIEAPSGGSADGPNDGPDNGPGGGPDNGPGGGDHRRP